MVRLLVVSVSPAPGRTLRRRFVKAPADGNGKLKGSSYTHSTFPNAETLNGQEARGETTLPFAASIPRRPKLVFLYVDNLIFVAAVRGRQFLFSRRLSILVCLIASVREDFCVT